MRRFLSHPIWLPHLLVGFSNQARSLYLWLNTGQIKHSLCVEIHLSWMFYYLWKEFCFSGYSASISQSFFTIFTTHHRDKLQWLSNILRYPEILSDRLYTLHSTERKNSITWKILTFHYQKVQITQLPILKYLAQRSSHMGFGWYT